MIGSTELFKLIKTEKNISGSQAAVRMDRYDDYTPHIFYNDEENDGENEATRVEPSLEEKKPRATSAQRQKKKAVVKKAPAKKKQGDSSSASFITDIKAFFSSRTTAIVTGIIVAGLAAYFLISFVSYIGSCLSDQSVIYNQSFGSVPPVANKGGEGGARLSEFFINGGFGLGAFVLVVWLICISLKLLIGKPRFKTLDFTLKCLIGFITLSLIVGLITIGTNSVINWGGYHGRYVNEWIIGFLGWWGAVILCIVMIALFVVICMRDVVKWALAKKRILDEKRRKVMEKIAREREKARNLEEQKKNEVELDSAITSAENESEENGDNADLSFSRHTSYPESLDEAGLFYREPTESQEESGSVKNEENEDFDNYSLTGESDSVSASVEVESKKELQTQQDQKAAAEESDKKEEAMVVNVNHIAPASNDGSSDQRSLYEFPSLSLLEEREQKINVNAEEQLANKELIKQTLMEYGVPIVSIEAHVGPTVTLYEIRPDRGNRISRIRGLVDEIAMSLAAVGVRIIAPIPGRGTIGIEVANMHPQTVSLRSILGSKNYQETKAQLPIAMGSTISNEVYIADLASIPHLLVAGATGQGKSVGLNVIIMSLLFKRRPDELKFVMFDPKMVEFNLYATIQKQYLAKLPDEEEAIITDMNKVVPTLNSLCIEMDNRYKLLKEAEVRKLEEYNKLIKTGKFKDRPEHRFLPFIVVVVDEFADLIMTAGKEVEMPIARLAQKARAVGIHVIIATQRPSTAVITGNIKSNFPGRMGFKVSSGIDSKVILDAMGAQQLIGKGDMLILNNSELVRVQCAFVDTHEVKAICEHIGKQPYPKDSPYILPEPVTSEGAGGENSGGMQGGEKDPLYDEIRSYVITSGIASTSNIQRKYQLGYNRAGRIMDQLESDGVVGPSQGGKGRAVLISS